MVRSPKAGGASGAQSAGGRLGHVGEIPQSGGAPTAKSDPRARGCLGFLGVGVVTLLYFMPFFIILVVEK